MASQDNRRDGERPRGSNPVGPERADSARIAALGIMHAIACGKLLRAHGRDRHAENFEAALDELIEIVAIGVGRDELAKAMDWAADRMWEGAGAIGGPSSRH